MSPRAPRSGPEEFDVLITRLDPEHLRGIVGKAAERHEDVARAVRLAATHGSGVLSQLKAEIDRGLRTSRYLGYRESGGWAMQARPIVEAIGEAVDSSPTAELVLLIERAIGHVVKVILKADDSDGLIGDLARELLDLHARACDAGTRIRSSWPAGWSGSASTTRTSSRWTRSATPMPWAISGSRRTAAR